MFNRTAASGAKARVSSSWKEDASHTIVTSARTEPTSELTGRAHVARDRDRQARLAMDVPDQLHRGRLAVRAGHGDEFIRSIRQPSSSSPRTGRPRSSAARDHGRLRGHPRALDDRVHAPARKPTPCSRTCTSTPALEQRPRPAGEPPESTPITSSPNARRASAAATPERARPTTSCGPAGICGRGLASPTPLAAASADALAVRS